MSPKSRPAVDDWSASLSSTALQSGYTTAGGDVPRRSEFASYTFIRNDLEKLGWNVRNPTRGDGGQLYTQQECLDHPEIGPRLGRQRPEYVVKVQEDSFWVIEAKGSLEEIDQAFGEAVDYARQINQSDLVSAPLVTGVAGNDSDGYLVQSAYR
jgi:type I restriction enzyme M protein